MLNNGTLTALNRPWKNIKVAEYGQFYRLIFDQQKIRVTLTFSKSDPSNVDYNLVFTPVDYNSVDYFLKVDSNIKNDQN